ncbi:MAG: hypothetical protein M1821_007014 [Bathelium mastoideum]|nr:MAG: hypothetical protein M1821_007014 [Bathelium mastoideum]
MQSTLHDHQDHKFESSSGRRYVRKFSETPGKSSDNPEKDMPEKIGLSDDDDPQAEYAIHCLYTDKYLDRDDRVIGEFSTTNPRTPKSKPKEPSRFNIPVIERVVTLPTGLTKGESQQELEALNIGLEGASITIHVRSRYVLNVFRAIVGYYPSWSLGSNCLMDMDRDSFLLVHYRSALIEYKDRHPQSHSSEYIEECNKHIDQVTNFVDVEYSHRVEQLEAQLKQPEPVVTYDQLDMLFKPGIEIYACIDWDGQALQPFIVSDFETDDVLDDKEAPARYKTSSKCFSIGAWNFDCDGDKFGRSTAKFEIPYFKDEQKIRSLACFPTSIIDGTEEGKILRRKFIERGKKFFNLSKQPSYMQYTGMNVDAPRTNYTATRCMCDVKRALSQGSDDHLDRRSRPRLGHLSQETVNMYPGCMCDSCIAARGETPPKDPPYTNWDDIRCATATELEEQQYFLCSGYLHGYILAERTWHVLKLENIAEPDIDVDAINQLELEEPKTKDLIKAICQNFTTKDAVSHYAADFVQGKGEGQVFLLHGPPGVGKTLTAECVAEFTGRPLLALTGGDIGSDAETVERNLRKFLNLGQDWNAVVLLDEADVYLTSRDGVGIERNSIISVFLREIEYYRGILFLTTNRVGEFDEAILSRIHFPLHFTRFDDQRRLKVWKNNIERLEEKRKGEIEIHYHINAYVEEKLAKLDWNGREIRNAFQTAVSLAFYEAKEKSAKQKEHHTKAILKMDHLDRVVNMSNNFKEYMKRTHRGDDPVAIALNKLLRDDRSEHERQQQENGTPARLERRSKT